LDLDSYQNPTTNATNLAQATAKAVIFKDGKYKGKIERIEIVDPGFGYSEDEKIEVTIVMPDLLFGEGGIRATANAIRELEVKEIKITNPGSGYVAEKAVVITVDPPPVTARINVMDPLMITKKKLTQFATQEAAQMGGAGGERAKRALKRRRASTAGTKNNAICSLCSKANDIA